MLQHVPLIMCTSDCANTRQACMALTNRAIGIVAALWAWVLLFAIIAGASGSWNKDDDAVWGLLRVTFTTGVLNGETDFRIPPGTTLLYEEMPDWQFGHYQLKKLTESGGIVTTFLVFSAMGAVGAIATTGAYYKREYPRFRYRVGLATAGASLVFSALCFMTWAIAVVSQVMEHWVTVKVFSHKPGLSWGWICEVIGAAATVPGFIGIMYIERQLNLLDDGDIERSTAHNHSHYHKFGGDGSDDDDVIDLSANPARSEVG